MDSPTPLLHAFVWGLQLPISFHQQPRARVLTRSFHHPSLFGQSSPSTAPCFSAMVLLPLLLLWSLKERQIEGGYESSGFVLGQWL